MADAKNCNEVYPNLTLNKKGTTQKCGSNTGSNPVSVTQSLNRQFLSPEINRLLFKRFFCIFEKNNVMARPSEYDFELCKEVCIEVANGANIKAVLASKENYPTFQTWCNWKREHNELFDLYTRSIQDKAESVDAQMDEIWEGCRLGNYDPATARILIDTLKWKAAKYYPKMFGDKVQTEHSGEVTTTVINLGNGIKPNEAN